MGSGVFARFGKIRAKFERDLLGFSCVSRARFRGAVCVFGIPGRLCLPDGRQVRTSKPARTGGGACEPFQRNPNMKAETLTTATALLTAGISDPRERAEALAAFQANADRRDRMLTTRAAATLAGVHRKTLFAWELKGYLHPRRITPSRVRWSRRELENFLCEAAEG